MVACCGEMATSIATDKSLLEEENIENTDVFCALTNDDEVNIMSSLLAKRLGARKVMTLINKAAYVDLVQGGMIDVAISPQQATIGSLLTQYPGDNTEMHALTIHLKRAEHQKKPRPTWNSRSTS